MRETLKTIPFYCIGLLMAGSLYRGDVSGLHLATQELATNPESTQEARVTQAQEVLGKRFKPIAETANTQEVELYHLIHLKVRNLLEQRWKDKAWEITRAIVETAQERELDPLFIMAIIMNESRFRPEVVGGHGEIGLMQIRPETAQWISGKMNEPWYGKSSLKDFKTNIRLGTFYLSMLRTQMGSKKHLYLSAYNMGPQNVMKLLRKKSIPTQYASRVLSFYMKFYLELSDKLKLQVAAIN